MTSAFDPLSRSAPSRASARSGANGPRPANRAPREEGLVEQLLGLVRRRKWIIVQAFVLVVVAALVFSLRQQEEYTASASLLFVDPVGGVTDTGAAEVDPTREAATNTALVQLPAVSTYASRLLGGRISPQEISDSVSVDSGTNESDLVAIEAVAESAARAAEMANAYAEGYIVFRRTTERGAIDNSIQQLQANLAALPVEEQDGVEGDRLRSEITALQAASARRTGGAEVVQRASPPSDPSAPNTKRNIALGAVVGLVLGLLLAALVDRLDRRVRSVEDLAEVYDLAVLAEVPRSRELARHDMRRGLDDSDLEPFRILRTNLRYLNVANPLSSLLVASPMRGDGKSTVARNLASVMAAMGDHVVLVEADLHAQQPNPSAHGLSTVLLGDDPETAYLAVSVGEYDDEPRHLTVLPAGPPVPNPSELLDSDAMRDLLRELEQRFDLVVVDGPATTSVGDSLALVPSVSGVLVVGGLGRTTSEVALRLRQQLDLLRSRPVGLVVNFAPPPPDGYGYRS